MRGFRKNVSSGLDLFLGEQTGMCECEAAYSETGCNPSGPRDKCLSNDLYKPQRVRPHYAPFSEPLELQVLAQC